MSRKAIAAFWVLALLLVGCAGMNFEPVDKEPTNEYEKAVYRHHKALEDQRRTILDAYRL